jgi:hypothetical protein
MPTSTNTVSAPALMFSTDSSVLHNGTIACPTGPRARPAESVVTGCTKSDMPETVPACTTPAMRQRVHAPHHQRLHHQRQQLSARSNVAACVGVTISTGTVHWLTPHAQYRQGSILDSWSGFFASLLQVPR